jgi:hypothetical protein
MAEAILTGEKIKKLAAKNATAACALLVTILPRYTSSWVTVQATEATGTPRINIHAT